MSRLPRPRPGLAFLLLAGLAAAAQAPAPAPPLAFDVVSVKPAATDPTGVQIGIQMDGAQVHLRSLQLRDLLRMAYNVKTYQIAGPDTLDGARYDIAATLPAGATREQVPQMLQSMLVSQFQLKFHRDKHGFPVYALVRGDNFKLKPSVPAAELPDLAKAPVNAAAQGGTQGVTLNLGNGSGYSFGDGQFQVSRLSFAVFADSLARFMDRPVIDATGLKDGYDFTLALTPADYRLMLIRAGVNSGVILPPRALALLEGASPTSLYTSLAKLGIRLVSRNAPLDRLVIDHISATPTPN